MRDKIKVKKSRNWFTTKKFKNVSDGRIHDGSLFIYYWAAHKVEHLFFSCIETTLL